MNFFTFLCQLGILVKEIVVSVACLILVVMFFVGIFIMFYDCAILIYQYIQKLL